MHIAKSKKEFFSFFLSVFLQTYLQGETLPSPFPDQFQIQNPTALDQISRPAPRAEERLGQFKLNFKK